MPPAYGCASKIVTRMPARASHSAAARPAGPAPMIATRASFAGPGGGGVGSPACSCSMMKRLICRIASGWSRWVRMQVFSHRWSQTRPRMVGSGLSRRVMRTASRTSPERTAAM